MGSLLTIADPIHHKEKKDFYITCGHYRLKGEQDSLEDEVTIDLNASPPTGQVGSGISVEDTFTSNIDGSTLTDTGSFVGLFDGHGGTKCSEYLADNLKSLIFKSPKYPSDTLKAIQEAFLVVDSDFLQRARTQNLQDGSTALVVYIASKNIYVASCGDSSGLICMKDGTFVPVVDSTEASKRGMGSLFYKEKNEIEAEPMTIQHTLNFNVDFIILGTWTFWQCVNPQEVIEYIIQKINDRKNSTTPTKPTTPITATTTKSTITQYDTYLSNICLDLLSKAALKSPEVNLSAVLISFEHKDSGGLFEIEV